MVLVMPTAPADLVGLLATVEGGVTGSAEVTTPEERIGASGKAMTLLLLAFHTRIVESCRRSEAKGVQSGRGDDDSHRIVLATLHYRIVENEI